ncbi:hypothetical protein BKM23_20540 [Pseudomonas syringae pv. syringae]|nr:hypothetical protein BKM23_20540 [Pseudomonas syringae pv. syringae]
MRRKARILILCKTYPTPSAAHSETSCVAGMDEEGNLVRLYPVPFRLVTEEQQFAKWQWIEASIEKSPNDHRPESHKIGVDTILGMETVPTDKQWSRRREILDKLPIYDSFEALEQARLDSKATLGLIRPRKILGLNIKKASSETWTNEELEKLEKLQRQPGLFDQEDVKSSIKRLEKVPFDFYYSYECEVDGAPVVHTHKIVDWEASQLYRKLRRTHGVDGWEARFRDKLETELPCKDLMFLMGTIHRFPHQWLIISLIYPPKPPPGADLQMSLF